MQPIRCNTCSEKVKSIYELYNHHKSVHAYSEIPELDLVSSCSICEFQLRNVNVTQIHISITHQELRGRFYIIHSRNISKNNYVSSVV